MEKLLTVEDVARLLKVSEEYVRRLARSGKLKGSKLGDIWRFRRKDVEAFVLEMRKEQQG